MNKLTTELIEELDAFNPRWQIVYATIGAAAQAGGLLELYQRWTTTQEGQRYLRLAKTPDHVGAAKREADAAAAPTSLPFGYENGRLGFALAHIDQSHGSDGL